MKQYITIGEVAKSLGVSTIKVNTLINQGKIRIAKYSQQRSGKGKLRLFDSTHLCVHPVPSQSDDNDTPLQVVLSVIFGMVVGALLISFGNFLLQKLI